MSKNHNDTHRKKRSIKPYTLDKKCKIYVDGICVMSYGFDHFELALYCARVLKGSLELSDGPPWGNP